MSSVKSTRKSLRRVFQTEFAESRVAPDRMTQCAENDVVRLATQLLDQRVMQLKDSLNQAFSDCFYDGYSPELVDHVMAIYSAQGLRKRLSRDQVHLALLVLAECYDAHRRIDRENQEPWRRPILARDQVNTDIGEDWTSEGIFDEVMPSQPRQEFKYEAIASEGAT